MKHQHGPGQIIQIADKLMYCHYSAQMILRIRRQAGIGPGGKKAVDNPNNHWVMVRLMYYQDNFLKDFADVMSYFHNTKETDVLGRVSMTDDDRKRLYELRGVITHITNYEDMKSAWESTYQSPNSRNIIEEFIKVRDYFFKWYYKFDKEGADIYQDRFNVIDAHFQDNIFTEGLLAWVHYWYQRLKTTLKRHVKDNRPRLHLF